MRECSRPSSSASCGRQPSSCGQMSACVMDSRQCCAPISRSNLRPAFRSICSNAWPSSCAPGSLFGNAGRETRLVARRGVLVDDALGGHLVHERLERREGRLGAGDVLGIQRLANALQAGAEPGAQGAVVLATLDVLPIGLEGRFVTLCHCLGPRYQKDAEHVSLACTRVTGVIKVTGVTRVTKVTRVTGVVRTTL